MKAIIVTNNLKVRQRHGNEYKIEFVDGSLLEVLLLTRDRIHEGYELLTHPLTGSVKPNETPYKSILISCEKGDLHIDSLMMIESGISTVEKFMNIKAPTKWNDEILDDFMEIDGDLINSGIESMRQFG